MKGKWRVFKNSLDKEKQTYIVGRVLDTSRLVITSGNIEFTGGFQRVKPKADFLAKLLNDREEIQAQIDSELGDDDGGVRFMGRFSE